MRKASAVDNGEVPIAGAESASFTVDVLPYGEESRWDDFVHAAEDGTFYHLAGWRSIFENRLRLRTYYLVCAHGEILRAVLPLVHVKSMLFGNALISIPFLVYGGALAADNDAGKRIVTRACELAQELDVDYLELRNQQPLPGAVSAELWSTSDSHVTFRKRLDPNPATNLASIPRKQRAMIRKGMQAGLLYEMDHEATRLYRAMLECKRNLGTPFFSRGYLQSIKDVFGDRVEILTVLRGHETVCSVMSFRYKNQILPYYGGGGELARNVKGNDFMYWCVMERACLAGVEIFDYGRSMIGSGAYRFKKHWGFEPEPLAYQHYLVRAWQVPDLNPSNPKYRLAINLWKRLPLPVAAVVGPPLARRLG